VIFKNHSYPEKDMCGNVGAKTNNEPVGKVLLTSENDVFGGHLTLPKYEIVDCGAFCEVIFFYISPKNLLGDFFYSLNVKDNQRA
jgi:hypothetical protein